MLVYLLWIVFEIFSFRKKRIITENFFVEFLADSLLIYKVKLSYEDLSIYSVKKDKNGNVRKIVLRTIFNQKIPLKDLNDMDRLYEKVVNKVSTKPTHLDIPR